MVENSTTQFGFEETPRRHHEATPLEGDTQLDLHKANPELADIATGHARALAADVAQRAMTQEASHDRTAQQLQVENLLVAGQNLIKMRQLAQGIGLKATSNELRGDTSDYDLAS